ncbi:MAG: hypothetical protein MZV65_29195 [Chromatiales bacterium]|nr:hypothetical protein [Chromatiales bacterium]
MATIHRREFIGRSAKLGAAALLFGRAAKPGRRSRSGWPSSRAPTRRPMAAKAVEILGGMAAFVPKGAKVALLPNVQSKHPGHLHQARDPALRSSGCARRPGPRRSPASAC